MIALVPNTDLSKSTGANRVADVFTDTDILIFEYVGTVCSNRIDGPNGRRASGTDLEYFVVIDEGSEIDRSGLKDDVTDDIKRKLRITGIYDDKAVVMLASGNRGEFSPVLDWFASAADFDGPVVDSNDILFD